MRMNAGGAMGLGGKCLFSFKLLDWFCMVLHDCLLRSLLMYWIRQQDRAGCWHYSYFRVLISF